MYQKIENSSDSILNGLKSIHVSQYNWLKSNLYIKDVSTDIEYQKMYRSYWVMRYISPKSNFNKEYFSYLENNKHNSQIDFHETCKYLSSFTTDEKHERHSFQFSFITKLIHMIDGDFPIYDSMVSEFYKLPLISGSNLTQKITEARSAIDLLKKEQDKIIQGGHLEKSIDKFKSKYPQSEFSDRKIIDSMIWAFISQNKHNK